MALGYPGSDPFQAALEAGVYRVANLEMDRQALRDLADLLVERVGWMQETQMLRDELSRLQTMQQQSRSHGGRHAAVRNPLSLQHLVKATQHLDRLEDLFAKVVEGVASATMVSRVGLFYKSEGETAFRLHAGRCCLDDVESLQFSDRDPLVRWLQRHPRLITRASLDHIADPAERALLRRTLDMLGAETFIPLNLRGRVLGWLFTGQTDGLPVRPFGSSRTVVPERARGSRVGKHDQAPRDSFPEGDGRKSFADDAHRHHHGGRGGQGNLV